MPGGRPLAGLEVATRLASGLPFLEGARCRGRCCIATREGSVWQPSRAQISAALPSRQPAALCAHGRCVCEPHTVGKTEGLRLRRPAFPQGPNAPRLLDQMEQEAARSPRSCAGCF